MTTGEGSNLVRLRLKLYTPVIGGGNKTTHRGVTETRKTEASLYLMIRPVGVEFEVGDRRNPNFNAPQRGHRRYLVACPHCPALTD